MAVRNVVNREARGFLDFFRAKVNGQGPKDLKVDIQPTIDMMAFTGSELVHAVEDSATGNPPTNLNIAVPQQELWLVHCIQLKLWGTRAADEGAVWDIEIQGLTDSDGNVTDITVGTAHFDTAGAAALVSVGGESKFVPGFPFLLRGGVNIQGQYVDDDTSGNYTAVLGVLYTRLTT